MSLTNRSEVSACRAIMPLPLHVETVLASMEPPDTNAIRVSARATYERPLAFWRGFIGRSLHYHLGHFLSETATLDDGMKLAVSTLIDASRRDFRGARILDVGCGWGGPAEQILDRQVAEVVCITNSVRQARFVRKRLRNRLARVHHSDIEVSPVRMAGEFDVILMYESLDHIVNHSTVLSNLRKLVATRGCLLIATSCTDHAAPFNLFSPSLGVQPLKRLDDLCSTLIRAGWYVVGTMDHTELTMPGWEKWRHGLRRHLRGAFRREARDLLEVFDLAEALYAARMLRSFHIVAVPAEVWVANSTVRG